MFRKVFPLTFSCCIESDLAVLSSSCWFPNSCLHLNACISKCSVAMHGQAIHSQACSHIHMDSAIRYSSDLGLQMHSKEHYAK